MISHQDVNRQLASVQNYRFQHLVISHTEWLSEPYKQQVYDHDKKKHTMKFNWLSLWQHTFFLQKLLQFQVWWYKYPSSWVKYQISHMEFLIDCNCAIQYRGVINCCFALDRNIQFVLIWIWIAWQFWILFQLLVFLVLWQVIQLIRKKENNKNKK